MGQGKHPRKWSADRKKRKSRPWRRKLWWVHPGGYRRRPPG